MNICWLASYPKSGNTWLRAFLYSYIFGELKNSADLNQRIPDIDHRPVIPVSNPAGIFSKTHFTFSRQHPCIDQTTAFIYILRHPKDVLLSNLNYLKLIGTLDATDEQFAQRFIDNMGAPIWYNRGYGSWIQHADSWLTQPKYPNMVLRYEEMKQHPRDAFTRVLEFIHLPVENKRLEFALEQSSFRNLKELEKREKASRDFSLVFGGNPETARQGLRFINEGASKQSLSHISESLDHRFDEIFGATMQRYGY